MLYRRTSGDAVSEKASETLASQLGDSNPCTLARSRRALDGVDIANPPVERCPIFALADTHTFNVQQQLLFDTRSFQTEREDSWFATARAAILLRRG